MGPRQADPELPHRPRRGRVRSRPGRVVCAAHIPRLLRVSRPWGRRAEDVREDARDPPVLLEPPRIPLPVQDLFPGRRRGFPVRGDGERDGRDDLGFRVARRSGAARHGVRRRRRPRGRPPVVGRPRDPARPSGLLAVRGIVDVLRPLVARARDGGRRGLLSAPPGSRRGAEGRPRWHRALHGLRGPPGSRRSPGPQRLPEKRARPRPSAAQRRRGRLLERSARLRPALRIRRRGHRRPPAGPRGRLGAGPEALLRCVGAHRRAAYGPHVGALERRWPPDRGPPSVGLPRGADPLSSAGGHPHRHRLGGMDRSRGARPDPVGGRSRVRNPTSGGRGRSRRAATRPHGSGAEPRVAPGQPGSGSHGGGASRGGPGPRPNRCDGGARPRRRPRPRPVLGSARRDRGRPGTHRRPRGIRRPRWRRAGPGSSREGGRTGRGDPDARAARPDGAPRGLGA